MTEDAFYNEIRTLISEIIEIDEEDIKGDAKFVDDLGVDSLMALEILAAFEKKFKVKIPEEKMAELETLDKAVELARSLKDQS